MVLLPEEGEMTLAELRQMAARQQHQIEAQQQLLVAKEQRLKFLKQQEARHHSLSEHRLDSAFLQDLRGKVESQEIKLRQLRALRGQEDQQKTNNRNLGAELDSIRALFSEKENELNHVISKVDELSRQLDEIRQNKNKKNTIASSAVSELDNLRRELLYHTKLSEQQNSFICQRREDIVHHQQDISLLDQKISELTQRLHRKHLLNQQLASQVHNATKNNINNNIYHTTTIVAVEPIPREPDREHTQDDIATKLHSSQKGDLNEFSLTKNDPKYQTLPYNTKFTLKGKGDDVMSSAEEDSWSNSLDSSSSKKNSSVYLKLDSNINDNSSKSFNGNVGEINSKTSEVEIENAQRSSLGINSMSSNQNLEIKHCTDLKSNSPDENLHKGVLTDNRSDTNKIKTVSNQKPAVPPKPALPVKPMILSRAYLGNTIKDKSLPNEKEVNAALNVLQKKSSVNEKSIISNYRKRLLYYQCVPRFSNKDSPMPSSKSKIATYFKKPLQSDNRLNDNAEHPGNIKRKTSLGQLPIKPKPLTIRKNPGLEPPKLKTLTSVNGNFLRRTAEVSSLNTQSKTNSGNQFKDSSLSAIETASSSVPVVEITPSKKHNELLESGDDSLSSYPNSSEDSVTESKRNAKCEVDEVDFVNSLNNVESTPEVLSRESNIEELFPSANVCRIRKGNLKGENSIRNSRRVSFDPLALLLDAALEGELELVKKTATEVPNLSAANDEGITALHNAICAGHFDVVTFLVEFGCDVNAQDSDGWTPLHCAASCNNLPMVKFLVERGACVFATTFSDQETAAEKCEEDEEGFDGCSEYLFSLQENLGVMNSSIVYAVYDYEVQNSDELSFKNGDMLSVLRKGDDKESEWWWSRLQDTEGYIPRNLLGLHPRVSFRREESAILSD